MVAGHFANRLKNVLPLLCQFQDVGAQEARVSKLYAAKKGNETLSIEKARVLLWMYTSRDVYRLLVQEGGFSPDDYEQWLAGTLVDALVSQESGVVSTRIGVRPSAPSHRRSHARDRRWKLLVEMREKRRP